MTEVKKFTLAQVKEHTAEADLWFIIRDKVYNVTKFLQEVSTWVDKHPLTSYRNEFIWLDFQHPGGDEVLKDVAGKDATKDFDDVGHSDAAM